MIKQYLKLIRPFHWVKNILIFVPLFFSGQMLNMEKVTSLIGGFVAFSLVASSVYVLNDIQDVDKDRLHPTKRFRPIASGQVTIQQGYVLFGGLLVVAALILFGLSADSHRFIPMIGLPLLYLISNIAYSNGLKNIPLLDVIIIAFGFIIRLFFGGVVSNVKISSPLFLTVVAASLFLGFGKRRNELRSGTKTRKVLKYYNIQFLDKIMYVCIDLSLVFYALWALNSYSSYLVYTVPLAIIIVMDYCLIIENPDSDGDPAEVLKSSKSLPVLIILFVVVIFLVIYQFN